MLSVIIPARDEEGCIVETLSALTSTLRAGIVPQEIIVVDDGSTDDTRDRVLSLAAMDSGMQLVDNAGRRGFRMAIRDGLRHATGDAIAIMMADGSDSAQVEMPLKAIVRSFQYTTVPITWTNGKTDVSKLKLKEMGSGTCSSFFVCGSRNISHGAAISGERGKRRQARPPAMLEHIDV